jgi:hypothetical protein
MTVGTNGSLVVNPGGQITVTGNFAESPGGTLTFGIDGFDPSAQGPGEFNGFLDVAGSATINGAIDVALSGFTPVAGEHWDIASAQSGLDNLVTDTYDPFNVTLNGSPLPTTLMSFPCIDPVNNDLEIFLYNAVAFPGFQNGNIDINAAFTPSSEISLGEAAAACGFVNFDWVQQVTTLPDPSPFYQINASNPANPIHLTSASVSFNDPPPGGYEYFTVLGWNWNSYPYYWETFSAGQPWSLVSNEVGGDTLNFHDAPGDPCLPGGDGSGCGGETAQNGSYLGFMTDLVGVLPNGMPDYLGVNFTWVDTYNCGLEPADPTHCLGGITKPGGVGVTANYLPADLGGTGGITILSGNGVNLQGVPEPPSLPLVALALLAMMAADNRRRRMARRFGA